MAINLLIPPAVEPVSLAELKEYLRVDAGDTSQDSVLTALEMGGRAWVEEYLGRRLVKQTLRLLIDFFPGYIDMKLAGSKISSPFVSGSNAVLVGIRYAVLLPYSPVLELVAFIYQNANGQVTSMITGPAAIASVSNLNAQPLQLITATPHGLQTGAGVVLGGNQTLLNFLGGQIFQTVTVLGPETLLLNGTVGDGVTSLPGGGAVTGYNFVYDLQSNPARLMPVFGQMWPVARVVANAIRIDYTVGYAVPLVLSSTGSPPDLNEVEASDYVFQATDIGRPISIPGATPNGGTLNTVISGITSPPGNTATIRDAMSSPVADVLGLLVNSPYCNPQHWELVKSAIKIHAEGVWRRVSPDVYLKQAKMVCYQARELRF